MAEGPGWVKSNSITVTSIATAIFFEWGDVFRSGFLINVSTGGQCLFVSKSKTEPFLPLGAGDTNGAGGDQLEIDAEDTSAKGGDKMRVRGVWVYASATGGLILAAPSHTSE